MKAKNVPLSWKFCDGEKRLESKQARPLCQSVPQSDLFMLLGLALSEKQMRQITENAEKPK